jgi:SNF2 family DNA or RNA helicase
MDTQSIDLGISIAPFATGWQTSLARGNAVRVQTGAVEASGVQVMSLPIAAPRLRLSSFPFSRPTGSVLARTASPPAAPAQSGTAKAAPPPTSRTRIGPPGDCIKLADRLFYVLQPALESILGDGHLEFPFHPFPYQFEGVAFLYPRVTAILADEMGLGKTMQAITAIRLLLHAGELQSVLLVCPKPLVTNWQREFQQWAPEIPIAVIEGDQAKRNWQWQEVESPVKIANYELLGRDRGLVNSDQLHFDLVVLDEAQRIKNRASTVNQIVRGISRRRSWALTGTPVENSSEDLLGIFEFLAPGYLHREMKPRQMGKAAAEFVLRRTKDKVLTELPPKLYRDAEVDLSPEQRATYEMAENEGVLQLSEMGDSATIKHVFELVLRLKQICNFDPATGASSKLERLYADIEEVAASGRKAIVFSQWVTTLKRLATALAPFKPLEFHGQIPSKQRDGVIQQFREDPTRHVILMSYGAGSVGLNLQFSEYVFLFDRWWNPAVEAQAENRAHRIGAAGPVTISRFLALGTIEERIDQVLREKRELFDTIFSDVEPRRNQGLTHEEIFGLFKLRCPSGPIRY